jgi:broad specificity phosphatase PhoE
VKRIFLLRHGATTASGQYCGSTDVALSEEGWQQMWAAVDGHAWHSILSSPLRRCADFAAALAGRLAVPLIEDPRLREMHFGDWEGRSVADVMASTPEALRHFWEDPFGSAPPRAEPLEAVRARVLALWRELLAREADERVLVVTHGGPIRILLAEFSGAPRTRLLDLEVPHAALFDTSALTAAVAQ